ncbi:hypothetical protein NDU88_000956 [Pleurodeles waltl]|uniref:Aquaporin 14 n=1 Tax=Pleurodeles waltl TaxID=8319 RepID=A0AAV7S614_PLEWA|nr:hypothetical protein NDU88_000956 [Pleurodeles waltl]
MNVVRTPGVDLKSRRFWCCVLAEALGTFMFVSVILGSSCPGPGSSAPPPMLQGALAAGFSAVGLIHCFGEISGAQVNPAITMALLCTRRVDLLHAVAYILAQCLGATLASGMFYLLTPQTAVSYLVTRVSSDGNAGQALVLEVFSTFQLAFTIFAVEDHRRREVAEPGPLAIGFSLTAGALTAVYWIGPVLGSVLAGVSYEFFFASSASREKLVACITCKDIEIVETVSISRSSLSTATQTAMRAKQASKHDN